MEFFIQISALLRLLRGNLKDNFEIISGHLNIKMCKCNSEPSWSGAANVGLNSCFNKTYPNIITEIPPFLEFWHVQGIQFCPYLMLCFGSIQMHRVISNSIIRKLTTKANKANEHYMFSVLYFFVVY